MPHEASFLALAGSKMSFRLSVGPPAPTDSLKLIFDPASAKKLASCGISLLDTPQEIFPAALAYLGRPPLSREQSDLDKAAEAVMAIPLHPQISLLAIHQRSRQWRSLRR